MSNFSHRKNILTTAHLPLSLLFAALLGAFTPSAHAAYEHHQRIPELRVGSSGGSAPAPALGKVAALSASSLTFSAAVGTTSSENAVLLANTGDLAVTVSDVTVSGPFNADHSCAVALNPGTACVSNISFTPQSVGSAQGELVFSTDAGVKTVSLTGVGLGAVLAYMADATNSLTNLSFVDTGVGQLSTQSVLLKNTGNVDMTFTGAGVSVTAPFSVTTNTCASATLAPGGTCAVGVTFSPTAAQHYTGTLSVQANAYQPATLGLSGTAFQSDSYFNDVVLLMQAGTSGAVDNSTYNVTLTPGATGTSGVSLDSTITKWPGTSSVRFAAGGYGTLSVPYAAAKFDFANTVSTWTVESWVYLQGPQSNIGAYRLDVAGNATASGGWETGVSTAGLTTTYPGYSGLSTPVTVSSGTWHHMVWTRNGNTYTWGMDGVIKGTTTFSGAKVANGFMRIGGNYSNSVGIAFNLQDLRMTKNVVRYPGGAGATYPVPTGPLPAR